MKNPKGFIQIPLLIAIIVGVLVLGGGGYFGLQQYQSYQVEKNELKKQAELNRKAEEEQRQKLQELFDAQDEELQKQKSEIEALQNRKPETITETIIKEIPVQNTPDSLASIIKQWRPIIAYIECDFLYKSTSGGSGLALDFVSSKYTRYGILTNAHVVGGKTAPQSCRVSFPDSNESPLISTKNRLADSEKDWAIVNIPNPNDYIKNITSIPPKICTQRPSIGDAIIIIGYPSIGSQTGITATEGIISGYDGDYFITSAKVEQGNSGGAAILVKDNCYLGIPSFAQVGVIESLARIFDISKL